MDIDKSVVSFIEKTRSKPALYLGKKSLTAYRAFIDGWMFDKWDNINDASLLRDFQTRIQERYNIRTSHHWSDIILFHSLNDQEAFDHFCELWDEFLAETA